VTILGFCI